MCGDTHGQYYDVLNIFEINGLPSPVRFMSLSRLFILFTSHTPSLKENPYVFNGDFVDRGSFSCEVILTFLAFRVLYPTSFFVRCGEAGIEGFASGIGLRV